MSDMIIYTHLFSCIFHAFSQMEQEKLMYSLIKTAVLEGIHAKSISIEVDISTGLPMFDMVGNLSAEVKEAKERVKTALHNCGIVLPAKRITINMCPANIRKSGTGFDIPIAVALLASIGIIDEEKCKDTVFIGELSLNGKILGTNGVLPIVCDEYARGVKRFVIPKANEKEALLVPGPEIYAFDNMSMLIEFLNGNSTYEREVIDTSENNLIKYDSVDFSEVNGQEFVKRACEIAAAGMHNMLLVGPPGAGKTMVAERLPTILPDLSEEEKLELSKIYSVCGMLNNNSSLLTKRPFRNPHHTITKAGIIGGGINLRPGEISLSHNGVLFLDELTEFNKDAIEVLRQPLEDHRINLVRGNMSVIYPANFLLLAAMNPCNCGYYPDMQRCRCTAPSLRRYFDKLSQPLIDRIDLCVEASALSYHDIVGKEKNESSMDIRQRVEACHELQNNRYKEENFKFNSRLPASLMDKYCKLGEKENNYMKNMYEKIGMTGRTYHKVIRVARTIADLDNSKDIKLKHLSEAICYRNIDNRYWGGEV